MCHYIDIILLLIWVTCEYGTVISIREVGIPGDLGKRTTKGDNEDTESLDRIMDKLNVHSSSSEGQVCRSRVSPMREERHHVGFALGLSRSRKGISS